jgi:DNA-binding LacI/PurR family transcriptional regulator
MSRPLTIQKLAKTSGVSVATVSRVLRGAPGVSPAMVAKVRKGLEGRGDFRPRVKSTGHRLTRIAFVAVKGEPLVDSLTAAALSGLTRFGFDYAVNISLLIRPADLMSAPALVTMLRENSADAAILAYPRAGRDLIKEVEAYLGQIRVPLVLWFDSSSLIPHVVSDERKGEVALASHLLDLGHRRIGYLGATCGDESRNAYNAGRLDSLRQTCRARGVELDPRWIATPCVPSLVPSVYYDTAKALLTAHPELTALYCVTDTMALAAMRACQDLGLRVPEDVSVTGFEGLPSAAFAHRRLATYRLKAEEMAYEASRLCYVMAKGRSTPPRPTVVPGELYLGESTCAPREG